MYVFRKKSFRIVFWKLIDVYPLTLKMKELESNSYTFSAGRIFTQTVDELLLGFFVIIEMLFEFVCR